MAEGSGETPMNKIYIAPTPNTKVEILGSNESLLNMRGELSAIDRQTDTRGRLSTKEADTTPEGQKKLVEFMTSTIESAINKTSFRRIAGLFDNRILVAPGIELGFDTGLFLSMYHLGQDGMPNQLKFTPNNYKKTFSPHYFVDGTQISSGRIAEVLETRQEMDTDEKVMRPGKGKSLQLLIELYTKLGIKPTQEQLQKAREMDGSIFDAGEYVYPFTGKKIEKHLFYVMVPDKDGKPLFVTRFFMNDQAEVEEFLRDEYAYMSLLAKYEDQSIEEANLFYMANRETTEPTNPVSNSTFHSIRTTSLSSLHQDMQHAPFMRQRILEDSIRNYAFTEQQNTVQYVTKRNEEWKIGVATTVLDFEELAAEA